MVWEGGCREEEVGLGWLHAEGGTFQAEATGTKGCFYLVNPKGAWEIFAWKTVLSNAA